MCLPAYTQDAEELFVAEGANGMGKRIEDPCSILYAFKNAQAGTTVWIKAGTYRNLNLNVANSGSKNGTIRFIGYKSAPGDIKSDTASTHSYGNNVDPTLMPLIQGNLVENEGKGIGLASKKDYVQFENFQISAYKINVFSSGNYNHLKNIISVDAGDFNRKHSSTGDGLAAPKTAFKNYSGIGIVVAGDFSHVVNCIVVNAGAEGIKIKGGDYQQHRNNKVYSDNHRNPTDYYYLITATDRDGKDPARHNILENIYVERVGALKYSNHGIVYKVAADSNIIRKSKLRNTVFEHNFSGVFGNLAEDITIEGGEDKQGAFLFKNGAHDNTVQNCLVINADAMAVFSDKQDGFKSVLDIKSAGKNNVFKNTMAKGCAFGVKYDAYKDLGGIAVNNQFYECSFEDITSLFEVGRANQGNVFISCNFDQIVSLQTSKNSFKYSLELNKNTFQNCHFGTIDFPLPKELF